jgi:hypothetical protein
MGMGVILLLTIETVLEQKLSLARSARCPPPGSAGSKLTTPAD